MSSRKRKLVIGATLAVAGGGLTCALLVHAGPSSTHPKQTAPVPVVQQQAVVRDVPVWVNAIGTVQAESTVTVHSRVDGQLEKIGFKEGDLVQEGQVLAELDPRPFDAQVHQAQANRAKDAAALSTAEVDLVRYTALQQHGAASGQTAEDLKGQVDGLKAAVEADDAALEYAKLQRSYATIKSPLSGRAGLRNVDVGNLVHATDTSGIVVLTQSSPITAVFGVSQDELQDLHSSDGQKLTVDAYRRDGSARIAEGELLAIDNVVDVTTGQAKAKASFANSDGKLFPGELVSLRLRSHVDKQAVTVPSAALQYGQNGTYVFVIGAASKVSRRLVTVGSTEASDVVLSKGVSAGEHVVVSGQFRLEEGTVVRLDTTTQGAH